MVHINTLVFCIALLAIATTCCIAWSPQQDNRDVHLSIERHVARRQLLDQLLGEVDRSHRRRRVIPAMHYHSNSAGEIEDDSGNTYPNLHAVGNAVADNTGNIVGDFSSVGNTPFSWSLWSLLCFCSCFYWLYL
jgi:hypothetical protein